MLIVLLLYIEYRLLASRFHFPMEVKLNSLQTEKALELVFR